MHIKCAVFVRRRSHFYGLPLIGDLLHLGAVNPGPFNGDFPTDLYMLEGLIKLKDVGCEPRTPTALVVCDPRHSAGAIPPLSKWRLD